MNAILPRLLVPLCLLALAACSDEKKPAPPAAGGQVMEGSISDAMLPYDTVRSQPPLAPRPSSSAASDTGSDAAEADAVTGEVGTPASPGPAVMPGEE